MVYKMGTCTRIYVGAWLQRLLPFIGVDDVNVTSLDDKVYEWNCVGYVIVLIPGNNGRCTQEPVDESGDDTYDIYIYIYIYIYQKHQGSSLYTQERS